MPFPLYLQDLLGISRENSPHQSVKKIDKTHKVKTGKPHTTALSAVKVLRVLKKK